MDLALLMHNDFIYSCADSKAGKYHTYTLRQTVSTSVQPTLEHEEKTMTTVVTDNCQKCRFTDCVAVCPVECFHYDNDMLYIDPNVCIDCSACIPECPVQAIYEEDDLPDDQKHWIAINAARAPDLPICSDPMEPLPGALERKAALGF